MELEIPAQSESVERPTTRVRGVALRDLDREFAAWRCAQQEAIGDIAVEFDERLLDAVTG